MDKAVKVRIEDTTNGQVQEWESNCAVIISVDEKGDDYYTRVCSVALCNPAMQFLLVKALKKQEKKIKKRITKGFREFLSNLYDEEEESDK
ncbi:MAG: hypothetical protein K2N84_05925 [Clostridia bacterium]|nr:hypothetical protein [Clostridia bacterium]